MQVRSSQLAASMHTSLPFLLPQWPTLQLLSALISIYINSLGCID